MLGITPEALDAVDVVFGAFIHECFGVTDRMMLPITPQRLVASKGIGVVDRALAGVGLDMTHQFLRRDRLGGFRIDLPIALQEPENHAFPSGPTAAPAFSATAEVGLVQFNLTLQSPGFELGQVKERLAQPLVDAGDDLDVDTQVLGEPVDRHELMEALEYLDLTLQPRETLRSSAVGATTHHVTACGAHHLERTAEHTLLATQKVGRAAENVLFRCNHRDLPYSLGYETP